MGYPKERHHWKSRPFPYVSQSNTAVTPRGAAVVPSLKGCSDFNLGITIIIIKLNNIIIF